jgi:predicted dehydrogenase
MKYTVAIIGCGWIGVGAQLDPSRPAPASHSAAINENKYLELSALVDSSKSALSKANELYPTVAQYNSAEELFENNIPDVVIIATEESTHADNIIISSNAGVKAILCEKPISNDIKNAETAINTCAKNDTCLIINHQRRFDPFIKKFHSYISGDYVKDTSIGEPRKVIASYDSTLYHGGTHTIDLLQQFFGDVISVKAVLPRNKEGTENIESPDALIQFKNLNVLLYQIDSREVAVCEVTIIGEKGIIRIRDMMGGAIDVINTRTSPDFTNHKMPDYSNSKTFSNESNSYMTGTYKHLLNCLKNKITICESSYSALKTIKIIEAIKESSKNSSTKLIE